MTAATKTDGESPRVTVRVKRSGIAFIDQLAEKNAVRRSEIVRRMLAYASANMPHDWTPEKLTRR